MVLLLKSLGISDEVIGRLDHATIAFQRPALLWAGLILLIPIGYWIYRRQRDNLSTVPPRYRITLTATRIGILAILVAVLAGPYLKIDQQITQKPIVAFVFDNSHSMQLPAGPFDSDELLRRVAVATGLQADAEEKPNDETRQALADMTRRQLARRLMQTAHDEVVKPLEEDYDVRLYSFSRKPSPLVEPNSEDSSEERDGGSGASGNDPPGGGSQEGAADDAERPLNASGPATHIGEAVYHVLDDAAGRPVSAVVLFSDGQNTGGRSPALAARAASDGGTPIFVAGLGSPQRMRDVAVVDVYTTGQANVKDTVSVHVTLESQGFDRRPVKVFLKDGDEVLDSADVVVRDAEHQHVELTYEARRAGPQYLTVAVPHLEEEAEQLRANNTDAALVRISGEKLKVLVIDGLPRWDFRFIKNAIQRDNGLQGRLGDVPEVIVETEWRRLPEAERIAAVPRTLEELSEYATVIVGDVSPELLTAELRGLLIRAVREKGLGLIVAAGPHSMPHRYDAEFQNLLPVKLKAGAAGRKAPVYNPFRLEVSPDGAVHEAMRLYDDAGRNQTVWAGMPPYYWCADADRPAPAATVLAYNPSVEGRFGKQPLIAYHYAGDGKVMFVGTDSTWLWRRNVGDRYFYKFWGQAIRFVALSDAEKERRSRIEVRPIRAQPGEEAQVELLAYLPDGAPDPAPAKQITLLGPGWRKTLEVTADKNRKGRFTGSFVPEEPGVHRLAFQPADGSDAVEATVQVLIAPEELRHPNLNRPALELLASTTGGEMIELDQLATIPDKLRGEVELKPLHREATLWDNWLILAILVMAYSLDVGIRRLMGLS